MSSTPGSLKRKHSGKTITELFTNQQKPNAQAAAPLSPTTKTKRSRLESSPDLDSSPASSACLTTTTSRHAVSTASMYHFPSKRADMPSNADIVDITSSPGTSPARTMGLKPGLRRAAAPNMQANGGPKRMLVKNFKPARKTDPRVFLDQTWQKVDQALDTVFAKGDINFSLEELYRGVENLCRQGMAQDTFDRLEKKCKAHIKGTLRAKIEESAAWEDVAVLRATLQAWATWMEQMVRHSHELHYNG
jgi:cullin-4